MPRQKASEPFARIPVSLLLDAGLAPNALRLAALIDHHGGANGLCFANATTLADEMGIDERTVRRLIDLLAAKGYIEKRSRGVKPADGPRRSSCLRLTWAPADDEGTVSDRTPMPGRPDIQRQDRPDTHARSKGTRGSKNEIRTASQSASLSVVDSSPPSGANTITAELIDYSRSLGQPPLPTRKRGQLAQAVKQALDAGWPREITVQAGRLALERGRPDALVNIGLELRGRDGPIPKSLRGIASYLEGAK